MRMTPSLALLATLVCAAPPPASAATSIIAACGGAACGAGACVSTCACGTAACGGPAADGALPGAARPPAAKAHASSATCSRAAGDAAIAAAVDHPRRSPESRARDPHRHPRETLAFFDVRPCQTVVEVNPGGGWYTEILAPVLRRHGDLRIATPGAHHGVPAQAEGQQKLMALLRADPATFGRVHRGDFQPPRRMDFGPANSADRILTFRNTHNWINNGVAWRVYGAALRALKPGGLLGVVQHRAAPDADPIVAARSGYVPEPWLIDTLQRIGFEFVASTEVNANPRDTKDHPAGVWTLPPSYRLGNQNRAAYAEIGESDRMTLLFRKPAHAHRHGRR